MPNTLKEIKIKHCGKLKLEASVGDMIVEKLQLEECDSINEITPELVPQARYLTVKSFNILTRLLIPKGTEELKINDDFFNNSDSKSENLDILSVAQMTSLCALQISDCKKLKSLPEHMQELLPSLKELFLNNCPKIESFPEGGLPFNLEVLKIQHCKKLVNGRKEWGLQRLTELTIIHDGSDEEIPAGENWELPCSIRLLWIHNMKIGCVASISSTYSTRWPV
nr:putative disease resistance protein At3g14460 [Nicotiana tomentosiformis]